MARAAVIGVILEDPASSQQAFNQIISDHQHLLWGRMGIPVRGGQLALISLTAVGAPEEIDHLTKALGAMSGVSVKTAMATGEIET